MAVRDFLQDANGDLAVVNGDFAVVGGPADSSQNLAVQQGIGIRLRLFLGEYYLDENQGVDYFGKVLVKNPNPLAISAELSAAIAATPDVTSVLAAGLVEDTGTPNPRTASIAYTVTTAYSADTVSGTT